MNNIKVVAMDPDGTLTQHKTPLRAEHRAVLTELSKKYKLLMVGAGLQSNTQFSLMNIDPKGLIKDMVARPFNMSFTRQINTARSLYGKQLIMS